MLSTISRKPFGWLEVLVYAFLLGIMASLMSGCKTPQATIELTKWRDRFITKRDTVVVTKEDSARVLLALEMNAWRKMMEGLKAGGPRTYKGTSNASLTLAVVNDSLAIDAHCDELELELKDALVTIETRDSTMAVLTRTVNDKAMKGVIPGWMTGTSLLIATIIGALFALLLLYLKIKKHLLKRT